MNKLIKAAKLDVADFMSQFPGCGLTISGEGEISPDYTMPPLNDPLDRDVAARNLAETRSRVAQLHRPLGSQAFANISI